MPGHMSAIVCLLSIESARDTRPDLQVLLAQTSLLERASVGHRTDASRESAHT